MTTEHVSTRSERSSTLRVLTWNTAHRKARIGEQLLAIQGCEPDIVALQEVIEGTLDGLSSGLAEISLDHVFASPALNPVKAEYVHHVREDKISDHSALLVEFGLLQ